MQRPIIFLATTDLQFQQTATDAVLETAHGLRRAQDFDQASQCLTGDTSDIALAIIDLDFEEQASSLLELLDRGGPDFPVLVIADETDAIARNEAVANIAADFLLKPIAVAELSQTIRELCRENEYTHEEHLLRLRGHRHHPAVDPFSLAA